MLILKNSQKFISGLLSLAITSSICTSWVPYAAATDVSNTVIMSSQPKGEIALTIRFALPQTKAEVESRNIKITLTNSAGLSSVINPADGSVSGNLILDEQASVSKLNVDGVEMTSETLMGSYNIVLSSLDLGDYTVKITGDGYSDVTQNVTLADYSKHIVVGTNDGTFSLGDFDAELGVGAGDQLAIQSALGSTSSEDIAKFDLDGDGKIDITDLSYVNQNKNLTSYPVVKDTSYIAAVSVDTYSITTDEGQNISDIFTSGNETAVNVKSNDGNSDIQIPIELATENANAVELSEIKIKSPDVNGSIEQGAVLITYVDENNQEQTKEISFDNTQSAQMLRAARATSENVITINLGQKVAVKKVTIKVTKVEGDVGYATISQIQFLKDITSNLSTEDTTKVKNLSASAGNESVNLSWSSVNNMTGYIVYYGTDKNNMNNSLPVGTTKATVSSLKNNTTYYFKVVAVNDDWTGTESATISATPFSSSVPGKPSNIQITPANTSLRVSWGSTKDATKYQVYYRKQGDNQFIKFGGDITATNTVITGLENNITYEVAIKAGNQVGFGELSAIAIGTPEIEGIEMPKLPTDDRISSDSITSITMANSNNVDKNLCPNFNVNQLIDNDPNTYWVAADWWLDSAITYTFDTPQDMNYAILVPYLSEKHKNIIKTYSIVARDADGNIVSEVKNRSARLTSDNYIILTFPQAKNIKSLTISLSEVEGGGSRVSVSEMAFYNSSTLADDIANLFADDAFTKLNSNVNLDTITSLEQTLNATSSYYMDIDRLSDEINLAKALYNSDNSALGVIKNDFVSRSAQNDNSKYGQSASALQPIGITAKAGSQVAIYAEIPEGEDVYIVPTQYYGESGVWKGDAIKIENGRNYITIPKIGSLSDTRGGALYLTYSGNNASQIKIHVRGDSNVFEMPILDLSNWYNINETQRKNIISSYITELQAYVQSLSSSGISGTSLPLSIRNATEIATPSVLLSMPADQILSGLINAGTSQGMYSNLTSILNTASVNDMTEIMYQNVLAWEEEMFVANMVQGIISSDAQFDENYRYPMETRQNIRYMRMFAGAFMYAAGEHIGVEYGSCSSLVQGKPTNLTSGQAQNGLFGWGIAHEIGHNMDKIGYAEITNNIYSMAMQAWDGNDMTTHSTRLTDDDRWVKIFDKVAQARKGMANDVFVQLGMYWQLHLAYDNAENPLDFYNKFFTKFKNGEYSQFTKEERIALISSEIVNRDLSEFFTRWGMTLGSDALSQIQSYEDEQRAIWYLDDESRNARLNGKVSNLGQTTVDTSVNENTVTLTITNNSDFIQGYEIIRNGVTIGFTTSNTFTDDLGAANNRTYTYEVIPVDKLGYTGEKVKADEVLISYDKTIDPSLYEMNIDGQTGTINITMKNNACIPVTGVKITSPNGGNITVKVSNTYSVSDDISFTTAKDSVNLESGTNIIYFNKPNADSSDTRIWTYDTQVMQITGVPTGATVELLDYPGDKVDFYSSTAVGTLKADYRYGDNADDVVKAGTLVVLGTYRGNPAYNYVEVKAIYNTTPEAGEVQTIERAMNGYSLMFAEIPEDGAVSDTSDGFFIFVPDLDAEENLNLSDGVTDKLPLEIKVNLYRTQNSESTESKYLTSETLWLSFPDELSIPQVELVSNN